jgi:hypothetical protein
MVNVENQHSEPFLVFIDYSGFHRLSGFAILFLRCFWTQAPHPIKFSINQLINNNHIAVNVLMFIIPYEGIKCKFFFFPI